jgi:hypothetical protein
MKIELTQGINEKGRTITHLSKDHDFIKYPNFSPKQLGKIEKPLARFVIYWELPKRGIFESSLKYRKRIEDILASNLQIFNYND